MEFRNSRHTGCRTGQSLRTHRQKPRHHNRASVFQTPADAPRSRSECVSNVAAALRPPDRTRESIRESTSPVRADRLQNKPPGFPIRAPAESRKRSAFLLSRSRRPGASGRSPCSSANLTRKSSYLKQVRNFKVESGLKIAALEFSGFKRSRHFEQSILIDPAVQFRPRLGIAQLFFFEGIPIMRRNPANRINSIGRAEIQARSA